MTEITSQLRAELTRLGALSFAEAYASITAADSLGLRQRARTQLDRSALWLPLDAVALRAARGIAQGLSTVTPLDSELPTWLDARVAAAIDESRDGQRASEPREWDAWAKHVELVAAKIGVRAGLGHEALELFHLLAQEERRLLLHAMRCVEERRTREIGTEDWRRFDELWRSLVKAVLAIG